MRRLLFRSYLFVPGDNERLIRKALMSGADAVVIDLEDSVHAAQKGRARESAAEALKSCDAGGKPIYVRINPVSGGLWRADVTTVVGANLLGVRLAKAESADEIQTLHEALSAAEENAQLPQGSISIVPTIESAAGVAACEEIAVSPRVEVMCFGMEDFLRDINGERDESGTAALYAQSRLVLASRVAKLNSPIASVYPRLNDEDGLRASSKVARRLGFFGQSCIHPRQIPVINQTFTPGPEDVAQARTIVAAFERAGEARCGGLQLADGQFIDKAIFDRASAVVGLAEDLLSSKEGRV